MLQNYAAELRQGVVKIEAEVKLMVKFCTGQTVASMGLKFLPLKLIAIWRLCLNF